MAPNVFYTRLTKMHIRKISLGGYNLHTFHNIWSISNGSKRLLYQISENIYYKK